MRYPDFKSQISNTDIYLIDQILKGMYRSGSIVLDAGCGGGRNLPWFIYNDFDIRAVDMNEEKIRELHKKYPGLANEIICANLEQLPFKDHTFDHAICSAVLHFAKDKQQFMNIFSELIRVLNPVGTLFIRMTSNIGIEELVVPISEGIYNLPDGSERFLLTQPILDELVATHKLFFLEPVKTVNVENLRCMTTLVLHK